MCQRSAASMPLHACIYWYVYIAHAFIYVCVLCFLLQVPIYVFKQHLCILFVFDPSYSCCTVRFQFWCVWNNPYGTMQILPGLLN